MAKVNVFPVRVRQDRMEEHVIERLAAEGDFQAIHDDEVKGHDVARVMHLRELDLLLDTLLKFPTLNPSFERSANRSTDLRLTSGRIVFLLQPIQDRIGFE